MATELTIEPTVARNYRCSAFGSFRTQEKKEERCGHEPVSHAVNVPVIVVGFHESEKTNQERKQELNFERGRQISENSIGIIISTDSAVAHRYNEFTASISKLGQVWPAHESEAKNGIKRFCSL